MHSDNFKEIVTKHIPDVSKYIKQGTNRYDVISPLSGSNNIGIELGVAKGGFSKHMIDSGKFIKFFGIDSYSDGHDINEYKYAVKHVGLFKNYNLLRMFFNEALDLFEDNTFDFIYVDGYAHTGEEGGNTLYDWFPKLKVGGIFSGDDYHNDWPLVVWAVNQFANDINASLIITDTVKQHNTEYSNYPSWSIKKTENMDIKRSHSIELDKIYKEEKNRVSKRFV